MQCTLEEMSHIFQVVGYVADYSQSAARVYVLGPIAGALCTFCSFCCPRLSSSNNYTYTTLIHQAYYDEKGHWSTKTLRAADLSTKNAKLSWNDEWKHICPEGVRSSTSLEA